MATPRWMHGADCRATNDPDIFQARQRGEIRAALDESEGFGAKPRGARDAPLVHGIGPFSGEHPRLPADRELRNDMSPLVWYQTCFPRSQGRERLEAAERSQCSEVGIEGSLAAEIDWDKIQQSTDNLGNVDNEVQDRPQRKALFAKWLHKSSENSKPEPGH